MPRETYTPNSVPGNNVTCHNVLAEMEIMSFHSVFHFVHLARLSHHVNICFLNSDSLMHDSGLRTVDIAHAGIICPFNGSNDRADSIFRYRARHCFQWPYRLANIRSRIAVIVWKLWNAPAKTFDSWQFDECARHGNSIRRQKKRDGKCAP